MKAVVLAAGKGSRLNPLTTTIAKPMVTVANRPVMEHIIRGLSTQDFHEIYSNLYHCPDEIKNYFHDGSAWGVSLLWRTETQLTGPAGGVATFADLLVDEDVTVVVSGDALHDVDLRALVEFHQQHDALLSVVMKRVPNPGRYGVGVLDHTRRIIGFKEKPAVASSHEDLVSCGIYCLTNKLVKRIPRGRLYDFGAHLIPEMAANGEAVFGFETPSYWKDIGTLAELRLANLDAVSGRVKISIPGETISEGVYLEQGATLGPDVRIVPPVLIGKNASIERGAQLIGPVVIGSSVIVGEGSYISQSVLLQGAIVPPKTMLVDGLIGTLTTDSVSPTED